MIQSTFQFVLLIAIAWCCLPLPLGHGQNTAEGEAQEIGPKSSTTKLSASDPNNEYAAPDGSDLSVSIQDPLWQPTVPFQNASHFKQKHHHLGMKFAELGFNHTDPDDPLRHQSLGNPLFGTSWRNRPYHADYFFGALLTSDLDTDINQQGSVIHGFRLGHDFDHYWGSEVRFGFADATLSYDSDPTASGTSSIVLVDTSMQYYPWGDSQWRPYGTLGLGLAYFDYQDAAGLAQNEAMLGIPFGIGMKYYFKPWVIFRAELLDNLAFGSGSTSFVNNLSFTGGFEYRFGANRPSYTR